MNIECSSLSHIEMKQLTNILCAEISGIRQYLQILRGLSEIGVPHSIKKAMLCQMGPSVQFHMFPVSRRI